jgi:hypothetical protein
MRLDMSYGTLLAGIGPTAVPPGATGDRGAEEDRLGESTKDGAFGPLALEALSPFNRNFAAF